MRVIIAGGRSYGIKVAHARGWRFGAADDVVLKALHCKLCFTTVLCGMQQGADLCGWEWADGMGIPIEEYPADWGTWGSAAGPIRNAEMAKNADCLIAFKGGSGTESMMNIAIKRGLKIIDLR